MPVSHARVRTGRAPRYLTQLREHTSRMRTITHRQRHAAPMPQPAESSGTGSVIDFGWGRCTLQATGDALLLTAEADDPRQLQRLEDALTARLQQIGRRDRLTVTWQPALGTTPDAIIEALLAPAGRADPFPIYAQARTLGPVAAAADGSFLVSGYAAVNQVLRDPGFGMPGSPGDEVSMTLSILRANPPDHGRMRSQISTVFTPRRIAALRPAIEQAVDDLLGQLAQEEGPVDFMGRFAVPLPVTVICELLGVPPADRARFRPLAADLTELLELPSGSSRPHAADAAARELSDYFAALIASRRAVPADDLISALATGHGLSDQELLANLILLLVAGFETTASLLGNSLAILLDRPDLRTAVRTGQIPVSDFAEEVLRYDSPVQVIIRRARTSGLAIQGVPVPDSSTVILLIGAANRDPARYPDPDRFDPSRTGVKPLSFGAGPHICIGNSLARLEAATAIPRLLTRFPALAAAPGQAPVRRDRLVLRGHEVLPIQLTERR